MSCVWDFFLSFSAPEPIDVLVIGSSVAAGSGAWPSRGWVALLAAALAEGDPKLGLRNAAVSGSNASGINWRPSTMRELEKALKRYEPRVVVISLSLLNEGLLDAVSPAQANSVGEHFEAGVKALVERAVAANAAPILCSVYPNNEYTPLHVDVLRRVHASMTNWGWPTIDFLAALDDGRGRWKPGTAADAGHPNGHGHRLMFEAIDLSLFTTAVRPSGASTIDSWEAGARGEAWG